MKIKGISPIEQHIEKIVLAVFALFAMAMFVLQFNLFGDPNAVQIDQRKVSPGQAIESIEDLARRKEGELDAGLRPDEVPARPGPRAALEKAMGTPPVPPEFARIALLPGGERQPEIIEGTSPISTNGAAERVVQVEPPTPVEPTARAFGSTINPLTVARDPRIAAALGDTQPIDARVVSVQATFPADQLRAALSAIPDEGSGVRPLPRSWWVDQVELLDVEVERQELGEDGSVVETSIVPPFPGMPTLRERISAADVAPRELPEILAAERNDRERIRRAPFLPIISGEPWIWPALAAELDAADPNRETVERLVDTRRRLMTEIERLKNPQQRRQRPEREPEGGPPDEGPRLPGGSGGPRPSGGSGGSSSSSGANIQKRIDDLTKQVTEIETRLKDEFGRTADGDPLEKRELKPFAESNTSLTASDAPASVTVWTHDLTAQPGRTYQYRVRVWVTNPLFGHVDQVGQDQRSGAASIALASDWSEPTAPVTIQPSPAVFVSSASTGEGLGGIELRRPATATLDVFAFHYGYWRAFDITLEPGDQVRTEIPIPAMPIWEVVAAEGSAPTLKTPPTDGPTSIGLERNVFLLGVVPASAGTGDLVFLAQPDGTVEVRRAGVDAESTVAARMRDSAARGAKATVSDPASGAQERSVPTGGFPGGGIPVE